MRRIVWAFIEFIRSTPLLVQVFFLFFVLPDIGIKFDPLPTGVIALGLHYSTYTAEVYRAGIEAVPKGQWEAATALSLPRGAHLVRGDPAAGDPAGAARRWATTSISMLKETPLLLTIGVLDIVGAAYQDGLDRLPVRGADHDRRVCCSSC